MDPYRGPQPCPSCCPYKCAFPRKLYEGAVGQTIEFIPSPPVMIRELSCLGALFQRREIRSVYPGLITLALVPPPQAGAELGRTLTTESHFPSPGSASGEASEPLWRKQTRHPDEGHWQNKVRQSPGVPHDLGCWWHSKDLHASST